MTVCEGQNYCYNIGENSRGKGGERLGGKIPEFKGLYHLKICLTTFFKRLKFK